MLCKYPIQLKHEVFCNKITKKIEFNLFGHISSSPLESPANAKPGHFAVPRELLDCDCVDAFE